MCFAAIRKMSALSQGANHHIQKLYYTTTTRSIIDYAAPVLYNLTEQQLTSLEVTQNNAIRCILGAPMWTRLCNLNAETNLPTLKTRIFIRNTHIITKSLLHRPDSWLSRRAKEDLNRHPDLPAPNLHSTYLGNAVRHCNLQSTLSSLQPQTTNPQHQRCIAPWEETPFTTIYTKLSHSKNNCTPAQLLTLTRSSISLANNGGDNIYYTDGSVDPVSNRTGAAVSSTTYTASWRTSDTCSTLQTELIAIKQSLHHSLDSRQGSTIIHTDSKSAIQALQHRRHAHNASLLYHIQHLIKQHHTQGRPVKLHWIPSHIGIEANDHADQLAKDATLSNIIHIHVPQALSQIKALTRPIITRDIQHNLQHWATHNSPSAGWYSQTSLNLPAPITKHTPRGLQTTIARLRLGYKCTWEIINPVLRECQYCTFTPQHSLLHYLLTCPATLTLRAGLQTTPYTNHPNAIQDAIKIVRHITTHLDTHSQLLLNKPPPR